MRCLEGYALRKLLDVMTWLIEAYKRIYSEIFHHSIQETHAPKAKLKNPSAFLQIVSADDDVL